MKLNYLILTIMLSIFSIFSYADKPLITFVCTGNTGRSPMAEALSKKLINEQHLNIAVQSRGVDVDPKEITPEQGTVSVLKERGIDMSTHKATQLTENDIKNSSIVLTMTGAHKEKILTQYPDAKDHVFTLSEYATGKQEDLIDPYGKPIEAYKAVENQLDAMLPLALEKLNNTLNTSK